MRNKWRRYCCMNNNMQNMSLAENQGMMEKMCQNAVSPTMEYNNSCNCGFDDEYEDNVFPENPSLRPKLCSNSKNG